VNRIHLIQLLSVIAVVLLLWLGTRRMKVVPGRFQSVVEMGLGFVRGGIAHDLLGRKDGDRFLPILTTIFFMVLFMNVTGIIPGLNMPGTAIIAVPLRYADDLVMTHVAVVSSLIPGSLVVETDRDRRILYLHVIGVRNLDDVEKQRAGVLRWEQRVVRALGDPAQYRALKADERAGLGLTKGGAR